MTTQDTVTEHDDAIDAALARSAIDRSAGTDRGGSVVLVLLVAGLVVAAATGIVVFGRGKSELYILAFLAVLATVGVFSLFALACGILRLSAAAVVSPLIRSVIDGAFDGIVVTDGDGRVVYANAAYLDLINASDADDMRPVERVFIGDADASEAIYRLLKAAREGKRLQEEVRVAGIKGRPPRWLRFRIRPLGRGKRDGRLTVWSLSDVTRERERQENAFQNLQHAIDYLDHAPAGFFSVDAKGEIVYLNATLAGWLDQDLAQVGSGGLKLADLVAGDGAALLTTLQPAPGEVKTEVLDLDLRTRSGRTLPVRLFHKLAFGADGAPGASRTLVLNRARDDGTDPLRAAEVRFMRFFHHTPMAIATVDKHGGVVRTNPLFARLFHGARGGEGESADRSIRSIVAERDRPALDAAIRQAAEGKGEIAPVDATLAGVEERFGRFYVTAVEEAERDQEVAIVYALETTAQRELENKVTQQQKMELVGQLAGGIAHDFNNVLSAIMMATDFLLNAHRPTDPSFQDIMQIKQNANRAASLVRHLLAFSRKQTMRPQVLDLGEVLSDLNMLLRRLIGEKVSLQVVHGRDLWPVKVDISQFEQVIVNLAVNARDAMPEGGRLNVRTANVTAKECDAITPRACRRRTTCWSRSPIPAPAFRRRSSAKSSSRSSRPRTSAKAPGSACPRSTASSSRPAASFTSIRRKARARRSAFSCRGTLRVRRKWRRNMLPSRSRRRLPMRLRPSIRLSARPTATLPAKAPSSWSRMRKACVSSMRAGLLRAATPCSKPATASRRSKCWRGLTGRSISSCPTWSCRKWMGRPCCANCAAAIRT